MLVTKLFGHIFQQNLCRNFHLAGIQCAQTYYDTLKLSQNCSGKEIREAFIKLSKQYHPDANQSNPKNHAQFVKLNEAYSVLSRPDERRAYDESLTSRQFQQNNSGHSSHAKVHYYDVYKWNAEKKSWTNTNRNQDYYGIRGVKRVSNGTIALLCIAVATVGVILQAIAIRLSLTFSRERLDTKSREVGEILAKVREDALLHTKEEQLELLRERVIRSGVDLPPLDFSKGGFAAADALGDTVVPADDGEEMALAQAATNATL